ncbi:1628_t:CDS:1 [Ambispora gerdemannii]|uniref:1628_t:CDS:1 n=1 Tax=Ambispora gerdemannii TaxID=144530 RepID=A0A9N8WDK1_9GLOM|nr:1628_t:CDS:1 [Ambispora gerdemannii]
MTYRMHAKQQLQLTPGVSVNRITSPLDSLSSWETLASRYKLSVEEKNHCFNRPQSYSNSNNDYLCFTDFFNELRKSESDIRYIITMKKRNGILIEPEIANWLFGEKYLAYLETRKFDQKQEISAELDIFKFFS